jgi:hypothetical protein
MSKTEFAALIAEITTAIEGKPVDASLGDFLNQEYGAESAIFMSIVASCRQAVSEGWMCDNEMGGIKFGRVIDAGPQTHGFSVDVVQMKDLKGPYHAHPNGEIDMIMPIDADAAFDGNGSGWLVYEAGSAHYPTVTGGDALVLYLLPGGAIDFKATPPVAG